LFTVVRLVEISLESMHCLTGIARIRRRDPEHATAGATEVRRVGETGRVRRCRP
jgi:hypothetical protein